MAIYGIGAYYDGDVSDEFIDNNLVGTGWSISDAPELHIYFRTLKVGDIVYIKAAAFGSPDISVKAIGVIIDNDILTTANHYLTEIGRNVKWLNTSKFIIPRPAEKNNVRSNTVYEEFHPLVQQEIIRKL
ncbi:MAG: hypothetical protein LC105_12175 [Chitinophagales bacterium]|nr:hypothetical protein [Chitinophagales bacterium]